MLGGARYFLKDLLWTDIRDRLLPKVVDGYMITPEALEQLVALAERQFPEWVQEERYTNQNVIGRLYKWKYDDAFLKTYFEQDEREKNVTMWRESCKDMMF